MHAEGTMCAEHCVAEVLYMYCRPMILSSNVTEHYRHTFHAEGTVGAKNYVAVAFYTHYRPMIT